MDPIQKTSHMQVFNDDNICQGNCSMGQVSDRL